MGVCSPVLNAANWHDEPRIPVHETAHPVLSGPATRQLSAGGGGGVPRSGACRDDVYTHFSAAACTGAMINGDCK